MISTYKKLASLGYQIGQAAISQKYITMASDLHNKLKASQPPTEMTAEEIKEDLEQRCQLLH